MKLEVGRKYVVRDPKATEIEWVRVDVIRPETELGVGQVGATVKRDDGSLYPVDYGIDGLFLKVAPTERDLVAEYVEPAPTVKSCNCSDHNPLSPPPDVLETLRKVLEFGEPPALELGPEHVGCRVRLRDGDVVLITGYSTVETLDYPVQVTGRPYRRDGQYGCVKQSGVDIVELLDEPRPFTSRGGK